MSGRVAFSIITTRFDSGPETPGGLCDLPFQTEATALRTALSAMDYELTTVDDRPAAEIGRQTREWLQRTAGSGQIRVVHVLSHGILASGSRKLHVAGAGATFGPDTAIEQWLTDAADHADGAQTLFVLDLCCSGDLTTVGWDVLLGARRTAWVIAASGSAAPAFSARLTRAAADVLNGFVQRLSHDPLSLTDFGRDVKQHVSLQIQEQDGLAQEVTTSLIGFADTVHEAGFFPPPSHVAVDGQHRGHRSELGVGAGGWRRQAVIDAIRERLLDSSVPVVAHGLPGTGKTVAICDVADDVAGDFEVVAVGLSGHAALEPVHLVRRLHTFLESRNVTTGESRADVTAALRAYCRSSRVLILLDSIDLRGPGAEVLPLLSGIDGIRVLATSRLRPAADLALETVAVRPMSAAESRDLVAYQVDRLRIDLDVDHVMATVPAAVLSHPQALHTLIASAARMPLAMLLRRDLFDPLRVVVDAVAALAPARRQCLAFVAALGGASLDDGRIADEHEPGLFECLPHLADAGLVHVSAQGVQVPDLVIAAVAEVEPVLLLWQRASVIDAVRGWFGTAVPSLATVLNVTAVATALARAGDWEGLRTAISLEDLDLVNRAAFWPQYLLLLGLRIDAADHRNDLDERVLLRCRLSRKLGQLEDLEEAGRWLREADEALGPAAPDHLRAEMHAHRAYLAYEQHDVTYALREMQQCIRLRTATDDAFGLASAYKLSGNIQLRRGNYAEAHDAYREALTLLAAAATGEEPRGMLRQRLDISTSIALCRMRLGQDEAAEQLLRETVAEMRASSMPTDLERALLVLALLAEEQDRPAEALEHIRQAAGGPVLDPAVRRAVQRVLWRLEKFRFLPDEVFGEPPTAEPGELSVAPYIAGGLARVTPSAVTPETRSLLRRYLNHLHQSDPRHDRGADDVPDATLLDRLREHWRLDGGDDSDLMRWIHLIDYRSHVLLERAQRGADAGTEATAASQRLYDFWLSGGHDLEDLSDFMRHFDYEYLDWVAS